MFVLITISFAVLWDHNRILYCGEYVQSKLESRHKSKITLWHIKTFGILQVIHDYRLVLIFVNIFRIPITSLDGNYVIFHETSFPVWR